jgi:ribosomal peptide maturation radical SAM protein 1
MGDLEGMRRQAKHICSGRPSDVLLVQMPFALAYSPAIGLSLLKGVLEREGISADLRYFNLRFAALIGVGTYIELSQGRPYGVQNLVGEWIFSGAVFEQSEHDVLFYVERILRNPPSLPRPSHAPASEEFIQRVLHVRTKVEGFLDDCVDDIVTRRPRVLGLSSTYQQHLAALALANRVKAHLPDTFIVLGGANCESHLGVGTVQQFPSVDAVVSGEGEIILPEIVRRVFSRKSLSGLTGVYSRSDAFPPAAPPVASCAPRVQNLDDLPTPSYDDFFDQLEAWNVTLPFPSVLLLETARGCWWGERSHCVFCSFNGTRMAFRSKSASRTIEEILNLVNKHPDRTILVTDRVLNMDYFRDLIPRLALLEGGVDIAWHTRPNLKQTQVRALYDAGIHRIMPGIESLSDPILKLMRKGVTAFQNIQLLKWCKQFGVRVSWNILWGFPSEPPEEYARMAEIVPLLTHLQPPSSWGQIGMGPFSPLFQDSRSFDLVDVAPASAYRYIYPFDSDELSRLAQLFVYDYRTPQNVEEYTRPLLEQLESWHEVHQRSALVALDRRDRLLIWDERPIASEKLTVLSGVQRVIYLACDRARSLAQLRRTAAEWMGEACSRDHLRSLLQPLLTGRLMMEQGDRFLSLAVLASTTSLRKRVGGQIGAYLKKAGERARQTGWRTRVRVREMDHDPKITREEIGAAVASCIIQE